MSINLQQALVQLKVAIRNVVRRFEWSAGGIPHVAFRVRSGAKAWRDWALERSS